jgi:hypothetical protein
MRGDDGKERMKGSKDERVVFDAGRLETARCGGRNQDWGV